MKEPTVTQRNPQCDIQSAASFPTNKAHCTYYPNKTPKQYTKADLRCM